MTPSAARPWRLLVCTDARSTAGAEVALGHLLTGLDPAVDVVLAGVDDAVLAALARRRPGARTLRLPVVQGWGDLRALGALRRLLRDADADLLHLNMTWAGSCVHAAAVAVTLPRLPVVAVVHLPLPVEGRAGRHLAALLARRQAVRVAVGERAGREVARQARLPEGAVRVVQNGVPDPGLRRPSRAPSGAPLLGCLARWDRQKGLDLLLQALVHLPEVRLRLVGGGPDEAELRALADRLGVAERVAWRAWSESSALELLELDLFVLPSRQEGLPLSLLEAMLAGVPVVATDVGSVREVVRDGVTGHLVAPESVPALVAGVRAALARPDATTEAARRLVGDRFSAARMVRDYEQLYDEVRRRPGLSGR